jgi:hypothetical protein
MSKKPKEVPEFKFSPGTSYADRLKRVARTTGNRQGKTFSIRDLANALGFSYEHVRRVWTGWPVVSKDFNAELCKLLGGLDENEMWEIAEREKQQRIANRLQSDIRPPSDDRLIELWGELTADEKRQLVRVAEGMLVMRHAKAPINVPAHHV